MNINMKILHIVGILFFTLFSYSSAKELSQERLSLLLDANLFATSSRVEKYSRQDWNSFFLTVKKLRFELGHLSKEEFEEEKKIFSRRVEIDRAFVQLLEAFERRNGKIYLIDPNDSSKLSGYEHFYALKLGSEWYAFDEQGTENGILARKNLSDPIGIFYELLED